MKVFSTKIYDAKVIVPDVYTDDRGYFCEMWNRQTWLSAGINDDFVQDNMIASAKGVLRGVHTQRKYPQSKIVSCVSGEIWDVIVDCRPESATFGVWHSELLSSENKKMLYVPKGVAHGFYSPCDSVLLMKVSTHYTAGDEIGFIWNDSDIGIQWPIDNETALILAEKDKVWGSFCEMIKDMKK